MLSGLPKFHGFAIEQAAEIRAVAFSQNLNTANEKPPVEKTGGFSLPFH
jgi:hypothetical protein